MSSDNTVADRLLDDARKKTARQESPATGKVALIVGVIALLVSPDLDPRAGSSAPPRSCMGAMAVEHPTAAKKAKIAIGARRGRDPDRHLLLHAEHRDALTAVATPGGGRPPAPPAPSAVVGRSCPPSACSTRSTLACSWPVYPGRMSALSTRLTRGALACTASTARLTTAMPSSQVSASIVVNIEVVSLGRPDSRTTRTASATTSPTLSGRARRGDAEGEEHARQRAAAGSRTRPLATADHRPLELPTPPATSGRSAMARRHC